MCNLPYIFNLDATHPAGHRVSTSNADEEATDPILSCAHGNPINPRGNRTVWYQFTAPESGSVLIKTSPEPDHKDSYDTIIAVYEKPEAGCADLGQALTCNDDTHGFLSSAVVNVTRGKTYLIEIADWQFEANFDNYLNIEATFQAPDNGWQQLSQLSEVLSRHTTVVVNDDIYIFGGQKIINGNPQRVGDVYRFNTSTRQLTTLAPMPSTGSFSGYSNTDGALLAGKVYFPSGYTGDNNEYDGTHRVYDIATDTWSEDTPNPNWVAPYGWTQVVENPNLGGYYVVGGVTGPILDTDSVPHNELFFFLPGNPQGLWLPRQSMNTARYAHVADLVGGNKLCVAGGLSKDGDGNATILDGAECLDITSNTWSTIASMNFQRFDAGSAVGPDGRWYVFGGTNANFDSLTTIEMYDPATDVWTILPGEYDLINPPRSWARGGFVGYDLWLIGGHLSTNTGDYALGTIDNTFIPFVVPPNHRLFTPLVKGSIPISQVGDTFSSAKPLTFNVPFEARFYSNEDFYDFFSFELDATDSVVVTLESIEIAQGYDVEIYNANKFLMGSGENVGGLREEVPLENLPAGKYYVLVIKSYAGEPTTDYYRVRVNR
jgi:hypothetical protein